MSTNITASESHKKISKIAFEILNLSRNTVLVKLRFLDLAINMLTFLETDKINLATNGKYVFYNPRAVLKEYVNNKSYMSRAYLHTLLHCIYRHMFINSLVNHELWNIACDIAVENSINELNLRDLETPNLNKQKEIISELNSKINFISAEKIYSYLLNSNLSDQQILNLRNLFCIDDHSIWYLADKGNSIANVPTKNNQQQNNQQQNDQQQNDQQQSDQQQSDQQQNDQQQNDQQQNDQQQNDQQQNSLQTNNESQSSLLENITSLEASWKTISEKIQTDLETFSKDIGVASGGLIQNLKEVNREKYDYTEFLKKFAVRNETMKINNDEFDYIFYTYGLKLFENMPLIEPLEYKEIKQIKDFVIAIDTSGSVSGNLVQTFMKKTYNILKNEESFQKKINLHIIQCDTEIQEDKLITNQDEFDHYIKNLQLKGFGGTDFRPVFSYVNDLIKQKNFTNLKGLIYFTDGYGTFPKTKPCYDVAFIYIEDEYNNPEVPPWAIKLVLREDEI